MQSAEDVQAEVPTQDIGSLVDAPVEQQPHSVPEALPSAPDAVPQPAADAMPFEPVQPDVLSPSQDAPEPAAGTIEESATLAVPDDETNVIFPLARIKKIIKADPEVKTVNKEALQLIGKATVSPAILETANNQCALCCTGVTSL